MLQYRHPRVQVVDEIFELDQFSKTAEPFSRIWWTSVCGIFEKLRCW